jgi:hypothetical protein
MQEREGGGRRVSVMPCRALPPCAYCSRVVLAAAPPPPNPVTCSLFLVGGGRARDVRMHLQEFAENSVDFAHFQPLHGSMMIPWTDKTLPLLKVPLQSHSWMRTYARWCCLCPDLRHKISCLLLRLLQVQHNAAWFPGTEEEGKHIAHFVDKPVLTVFGKEIPKSGANADITFVGASTPLCPPPRSPPPTCAHHTALRPHVCHRFPR